jgi:hypothetical protein
MLPYVSEIQKFEGKEHCLFCGSFPLVGYRYRQIIFPKNMGIDYKYRQTCLVRFVCESCHLKEEETKTIHNDMEYWAKVQVGFEEYPPDINISTGPLV